MCHLFFFCDDRNLCSSLFDFWFFLIRSLVLGTFFRSCPHVQRETLILPRYGNSLSTTWLLPSLGSSSSVKRFQVKHVPFANTKEINDACYARFWAAGVYWWSAYLIISPIEAWRYDAFVHDIIGGLHCLVISIWHWCIWRFHRVASRGSNWTDQAGVIWGHLGQIRLAFYGRRNVRSQHDASCALVC